LKRYGDVLDVDDRNLKRLKHSPLRQSITFNVDDVDEEDESERGSHLSFQAFNAEGDNTGDIDKLSEFESDNIYQDSELVFEGGGEEVDIDEVEQDYEEENDESEDYDYDYDAGNQSDDEGGDDDFDDEEYAQYFEENLKQPGDQELSKSDETFKFE